MSLGTIQTSPLDPNLYTGPGRFLGPPIRSGNVVLNTPYGVNGAAEFATWLYVGVTGNVSYVKWDGTTQVLVGVLAGFWQHIPSVMINSVGTTATSLVWGS